jgi:hypothetical protein
MMVISIYCLFFLLGAEQIFFFKGLMGYRIHENPVDIYRLYTNGRPEAIASGILGRSAV